MADESTIQTQETTSISEDTVSDEARISAASDTILSQKLSSAQERRLADYIDEKMLEVQRQYKKREYETSVLRTLPAYLSAVHPLLTLVLMIPPIGSSAHLRVSLLLRLTGEFLECVPGYNFDDLFEPDVLAMFMNFFDELDRGWHAVLCSQTWNASTKEGEDLILPADVTAESSFITQTDKTRLRSLLISGTEKLLQWLEDSAAENGTETDGMLKHTEYLQDLFQDTLTEMGELQGSVVV